MKKVLKNTFGYVWEIGLNSIFVSLEIHIFPQPDPVIDRPPPQSQLSPANTQLELASLQELTKIVDKLPKTTVPGWDGIHNSIIKKLWPGIGQFMLQLTNLCLQHGLFPTPWKTATLTMLQKRANREPPHSAIDHFPLPPISGKY